MTRNGPRGETAIVIEFCNETKKPTISCRDDEGALEMDVSEACRLAKGRRCECTKCFYCDRKLDHHHQHDHFPVPRVALGTTVVPACLDCHDLKDRFMVTSWPLEAYVEAVQGLIQDVNLPDLASAAEDCEEWFASEPSLRDEAIIERWATLSPLARVLYGKIRAGHEEEQHRARVSGKLTDSEFPSSRERLSTLGAIITSHARRVQASRTEASTGGHTLP
jgi:hypothetical protein